MPHLNFTYSLKPRQHPYSLPCTHPLATPTTSPIFHQFHLPLPTPRLPLLHYYTTHLKAIVFLSFLYTFMEDWLKHWRSTMENHPIVTGLPYLLHFIGSGMPILNKEKPRTIQFSSHFQSCQQVSNETTIIIIFNFK